MNVLDNKKGFTIIEVVLVLAIAGLIFLMVFIALPALQRNQRDQARRADVGTVASAYTTYMNNNRGNSPNNGTIESDDFGKSGTGISAFARYIDSLSSNTTSVVISAAPTGNPTVEDGQIRLYKNSKCGDTEGTVVSGTARQTALLTKLESGNATFCQTN